MTTRIGTWVAAGAVVLGAAAAWAATGLNGYTATKVLDWNTIRSQVVYPSGYTGPTWSVMASSSLMGDRGPTIAANAAGDLYFLASGVPVTGQFSMYCGAFMVRGSTCTQLTIVARPDQSAGTILHAIGSSPVTSGALTAGQPVVMRRSYSGGFQQNLVEELVALDPTTSPATETVLWTGTGMLETFAVALSGRIYVLDSLGGRTLQLTWNGSTGTYDTTQVPTPLATGWFLHVGPDGALYTTDTNVSWTTISSGQTRRVYRVDPTSGATSVYSTVPKTLFVGNSAWDTGGALRIVVRNAKGSDNSGYVSTAVAGGSVLGSRDAIGAVNLLTTGLATGPSRSMYVLEPGVNGGTISVLRP